MYLAVSSTTTPEVVCVKFALPRVVDSPKLAMNSQRGIVFENAVSLHTGKHLCQRVKLIISSKVKYLLAATRSEEEGGRHYLELWELSPDLQRDFIDALADPVSMPHAEVPAAWSMIVHHQLPAAFLTWSLPSDRFVTNGAFNLCSTIDCIFFCYEFHHKKTMAAFNCWIRIERKMSGLIN